MNAQTGHASGRNETPRICSVTFRRAYLEELWCDGEPIASGELQHLLLAPEACPHHHRVVPVLLIVAVNLGHADAARVLGGEV